jgi:peptide/nickel transport system substrate-binding protein
VTHEEIYRNEPTDVGRADEAKQGRWRKEVAMSLTVRLLPGRSSPHRSARTLVLAMLVMVLTVAAACQGSGTSGSGSTKVGGTLVVGRTADIDLLDPHKATAFQTVQSLEQIYDSLVEFDRNLNLVPGLATKWAFSDNGNTLTFNLRTGVKFGDGTPFSSQDVAGSLNRVLDQKTSAVARSNIAAIQSIDNPDANTVVLHLSSPNVAIVSALVGVNVAILSAKDIAAGTVDKQPNGTGPFKFQKWLPNQELDLVRNDTYWGAKPPLDGVTFRVIPDENSVVSAVESGNVQLGVLTDPLAAKQADSGGLKVDRSPQLNYHVLQLNSNRGPLGNVTVRQAIACAIDRKQVLDTAALGEGKVTGPITSPAYLSNPSDRPCPNRDVAKAKQLLQQAGQSSGFTLDTIVETGEYATAVNEAQNVQAQLKDIGVNLNLEVLEAGAYVKRWLAADFEAAIALNGGRPDPDTMYGRYFTTGGSLNKVAAYGSPQLDQLFASGRTETDAARRKATYKQISEDLEQNAPWVWLFTGFNYNVMASRVHNFTPMANGSLQYLRETSLS